MARTGTGGGRGNERPLLYSAHGAWESIMHVALVASFLLGGLIVPIVGGRGAYAVGGINGVIGTLLLLPLLRWLPQRDEPSEQGGTDPAAVVTSTGEREI